MQPTYTPTPVEEIKNEMLSQATIRLLVKREDLNHPHISGNKWWKLKYNLEAARQQGYTTLLTFGGAFSNHIYATAAAAHECGFKSIGIIRGEETLPLNPTLQFANEHGMHLHYVSRETYRTKTELEFLQYLKAQFGNFYLIPEGGTNQLAVKGCEEFAATLKDVSFDYLCLAVGTGGTISGLIRGLNNTKEVLGFSVLKGSDFLRADVEALVNDQTKNNWQLLTQYHLGGYAKKTEALTQFIKDFSSATHIPLDFVYTGKMMWGVFDLVQQRYFKRGSTVLVIHTGGLQGGSKIP